MREFSTDKVVALPDAGGSGGNEPGRRISSSESELSALCHRLLALLSALQTLDTRLPAKI